MNRYTGALHLVLVLLFASVASCQASGQQAALNDTDKQEMLTRCKALLTENYYFQHTVKATCERLDSAWRAGRYRKPATLAEFFRLVEEDIHAVTRDKHIRFYYQAPAAGGPSGEAPRYLASPSFANAGLRSLEVLPGNIGYLNITGMGDFESDRSVLAAAFTFLKNTDALIIDLRRNGGGGYSRLLASYLLPEDSLHLITYKWKDGRVDSIYTFRRLEGPRYHRKPVFLLTSVGTFSSAEEFTYDLVHLKRVTVVGDTTGGGANPGRSFPCYQFPGGGAVSVFIPFGEVVNAVTGGNWEGQGIVPHVLAEPAKALAVAQLKILEQKQAASTNPEEIRLLQWTADEIRAELQPVALTPAALQALEGRYGPFEVRSAGSALQVLYNGRPQELTPLAKDFFVVKGGAQRYRFGSEQGRQLLTVLYRNGRRETFGRD